MTSAFALEYALTRTVHWRWISPISYAGAFMAIVLLTVVDVALVGYETVNVFRNDFNFTQRLWYHHLIPQWNFKPGSLCEPHLFNIGDQLPMSRNSQPWDWTVVSVESTTTNVTSAGFPYSGNPLVDCDVTRIEVHASGTIEVATLLECFDINGYHVTLTRPFKPEYTNRKWTGDFLYRPLDESPSDAASWLPTVGSKAYSDLLKLLPSANDTYFALAVLETPCPILFAPTDCAQKSPQFNAMTFNSFGLPKNMNWPPTTLDRQTYAPLWNLLQTVHALIRVELGLDSPNNFLLHKESIAMVIVDNGPNSLYSKLTSGLESGRLAPSSVILSEPATIEAPYLCKYQQLKSPGSLVVSVLAAVLSMFSSGWAVYLFVISSIAKRSRGANMCEAHKDTLYQSIEMAASEVATMTSSREHQEAWPEDIERAP